jgi:nitrate reductase gamma subunit
MVQFMGWAHGILTLQPGAAAELADVDLVFKLHIILGLTLFLITPFTRLIHIWSAPIWFLLRPGYQIVRSRSLGRSRGLPVNPMGPSFRPMASDAVTRAKAQSGQAT